MKQSRVLYTTGLPKLQATSALLIYDQKLGRKSLFKDWIQSHPQRLAVRAGEDLKSIDEFPSHLRKVLKKLKGHKNNDFQLVAVGGGSVGDFVGFISSVIKRGVPLVHVPTTWLAAIDSAHGGKTALNVGQLKNQVGSFYPAKQVVVSKKLLSTQSDKQLRAAYGELFKIALIQGGEFSKRVLALRNLSENSLWRLLPDAIQAKLRIVKKDPYEKKKLRYLLNLGHSFGHVLELHLNMPHGEAVLQGLEFALDWSFHRGILTGKDFRKIKASILFPIKKKPQLSKDQVRTALVHDKKSAGNKQLYFVFVATVGKCVVKKVKLSEVVEEAQRQGWVRRG